MSGVKWCRQTNVGLVTCLPANLWPGGNTKQLLLVQDYPNREGETEENRGDIPDMWGGLRPESLKLQFSSCVEYTT